MQARGDWNKVFKIIRLLKIQPKVLYPEKLSFKRGREIDFPNKYWRNLLPIDPTIHKEMLYEVFWIKKENDKLDTQIYLKKERPLEKEWVKLKLKTCITCT